MIQNSRTFNWNPIGTYCIMSTQRQAVLCSNLIFDMSRIFFTIINMIVKFIIILLEVLFGYPNLILFHRSIEVIFGMSQFMSQSNSRNIVFDTVCCRNFRLNNERHPPNTRIFTRHKLVSFVMPYYFYCFRSIGKSFYKIISESTRTARTSAGTMTARHRTFVGTIH